ncbi:transcriptional regulator with XRE-family HTH domain [Variovorax sp. OAS795]|uniref:helix-turn-helix domain-containing protein n=1 Tax=Variovorax sp. OAS795 TaxID=3034231 RepID=UPI0033988CB2
MTNLRDRLREERKRLGLNQTALGTAGGVSKDAQLNYENGSRNPDATYLSAIAGIGVDVQFLLTGVRRMEAPQSVDELQLLADYKQLGAEDQLAIRRVVASLAKRNV